jgi:DNA-binding transcriptional ArsR family regulator
MEMRDYSYIGTMDRLVHPNLKDVSLAAALHALADPVRLDIVARLVECPCLNASTACAQGIPKSTISNHLNVLRAAGLIETSADGRERINRLRRVDFDARFPGLLDSVLANKA